MAALPPSTCAQAMAPAGARHSFSIAAGPAARTIPEFARQSGLALLANGDDLAGVSTPAVRGAYSASEGLARLLAGTRLEAKARAGGSLLIQRMPPAPAGAPPVQEQVQERPIPSITVFGPRQAEQTSIERKQNAATIVDTVIAEDTGSFPDNNVAEAISRIAGVSLYRGEYGEGMTVSLRGVAPSETRVEIDGQAVMSPGGTDLNGGGEGRGVELRELPAELIASVDVVKGYTADMTEGSLGGAIIIKTRTGFDFKRRTVSFRASQAQNSINGKWTPSANLLFADQYLDGRLGLVFNLSRAENRLESHQQQINDSNSGYARLIDFDNSPEKTFSFNPATVSATNPAAQLPVSSWGLSGGGRFNSLTPLEVVTRAAAALSKQDCYSAFPWYTAAQLAPISRQIDRAAAQNTRAEELRTCLNQWNDYTPSTLRYAMKRMNDTRLNADLRLDFKVSQNLSVYAKFNGNRRSIEEQVMQMGLGSINIDGSLNGVPVYTDTAGGLTTATRAPTAAAAAVGFTVYPGSYGNAGIINSQFAGLTAGRVTNIVPGSVVVDASHHVTQLQIANGAMNNDGLWTQMASDTRFGALGAAWRDGRFKADLLWGRTSGEFWRYNLRSNVAFPYGAVTMSVTPNGLWTYVPASGSSLDQNDMSRYGVLVPQANGQLRSTSTQLTLDNPRAGQQSEHNLKLDMAYAAHGLLPFLGTVKFGASRRGYTYGSWTGSGYTVTPGVVVPQAAVGSSFYACETGTSASATACPYGVTYSTSLLGAHNSSIALTQAAYRDIVAQALAAGQSSVFYNSARDRPYNLFQTWQPLNAARVIALTGVQYMNLDCLKTCMANDGKVYEQPRTWLSEQVTAGYVSTNFSLDRIPLTSAHLPDGMALEGNLGWRYVRTRASATGLLTFRSIQKTAAYNPLQPDAAAGIATTSTALNTPLERSSTDIMPVANLALWAVPDTLVLRLARSKAIARPPVSRLVSSGATCTYDERRSDTILNDGLGVDMSCDGTLGNPGLRPKTNRNTDLSAEWYVNRGTMLSLAAFRQHGLVGGPQLVTLYNQRPFDSGTTDPNTGRALGDVAYSYQTWVNGPAITRTGIEAGAKAAFTFLPSLLRHTGGSANITWVRSRSNELAVLDPVSGDEMRPAGEQKYSWNASLWYDDNRLSMRVALQVTTPSFLQLALGNYAPANGVAASENVLNYNPGPPLIRDTRRWVDVKLGYKFSPQVELVLEARNLGRAAQTDSTGAYAPYADGTPGVVRNQYGGARYSAGLVFRL